MIRSFDCCNSSNNTKIMIAMKISNMLRNSSKHNSIIMEISCRNGQLRIILNRQIVASENHREINIKRMNRISLSSRMLLQG